MNENGGEFLLYVYLIRDVSSKPSDVLRFARKEDEFHLLETDEHVLRSEHVMAYEVIDANGALPKNGGFAVLNNIPVTNDGRLEFERRFNNRARMVDDEPGFKAIRILRPLHCDTYIVLTIWSSENDFKAWQQSQAYGHAHRRRGTSEGIDVQRPSIFPRPSYVTTYELRPLR